ncbi:MAG: GTPase HflX [Candidatus Kapaibacterium sp.]|nr:GTPase HflX [Bacteroidota bacterium]
MINETRPVDNEVGIAVAVTRKGSNREVVFEHLDELEFLAETAHVEIAARLLQERDRPDIATVIGKGKVEELKELVADTKATVVIFDDDLSPAQSRNLERELEVKVIDRSSLILDIFATRARSVEARTQVELAQYQYLYPRLTRMWSHLSKQYGGVGTKGPGETQIETDRRIVRYRIQRLKEKLEEIDMQRQLQRKQRTSLVRYALVGYTNAGKSTMMNALTNAEVYIEDKLFATLDTTVRQFELPSGQTALLSDTVGFIRKLPTHLVASFRSTFAESVESDMLIHVVDVTNPTFRDHIAVVQDTLESLDVHNKPSVLVFNKIDAVEDGNLIADLEYEYPGCIFVSAVTGLNIRKLTAKMQEYYDSRGTTLSLQFPYSAMKELSALYNIGEVLERKEDDLGIKIKIRIPTDKSPGLRNKLEQYICE